MGLLILLIAFGFFVILATTSQLWGVDSRDDMDSREWLRKRNSPSHHL